MKLSRIQQIIKEEVAKAVKENSSNYATKVGLAIKADAKGKSENEIIKLISNYLKQDGNTPTERSNLMNSEDFIPDVLYTINHKTENKNDELNDKFKKAVGFQEPAPGGPENVKGLPLEKLPKYQQLADTREEEWELRDADKIPKSISLPSVDNSIASEVIYSKEAAQEWVKDFMDKWGLQPGADKIRFGFNAIENPIVINGSDRYNEWKGIDIDPSKYGRLD